MPFMEPRREGKAALYRLSDTEWIVAMPNHDLLPMLGDIREITAELREIKDRKGFGYGA